MARKKSNIRFVSKIITPINSFWVEDYSDEEKEFFINLGFVEVIYNREARIFERKTLIFNGSGPFGFWSEKEMDKITFAMKNKFPKKYLTVEQFFMN